MLPFCFGKENCMEKIAYTVAENGEYHDSGRYYTDIDDIRTAQYIYMGLCKDKYTLGRPALGISYETDEEKYQIDIVSNGVLHIDIMEHLPAEFSEDRAVKQALEEIREAFPDYIDLSEEADYGEIEL